MVGRHKKLSCSLGLQSSTQDTVHWIYIERAHDQSDEYLSRISRNAIIMTAIGFEIWLKSLKTG